MIDGDELDGLTKWKRYINFKPGERKRLKRKYNKRVRRFAKVDLSNALSEYFEERAYIIPGIYR